MSNPLNMSDLLDNLHWRYAVKIYDTEKKLSDEQVNALKEAMRLSPSNSGIQPWKIVHIRNNPELRQQLKAAGYNQAQFDMASDVFVLASYKSMDEAYVRKLVQNAADAAGKPFEELQGFYDYLMGVQKMWSADPKNMEVILSRQVFIALGMALFMAAQLHIDASPMGGFSGPDFDRILGLDQQGLASQVVFAAGYRSPEDQRQFMPKARFSQEEVFIEK